MAAKYLILIVLLLAGIQSAAASSASSCANCVTQARVLADQQANQKTQSDLLQRNRDYLATLTKDDVSKSIKVKSNILIFMVRIETLKNNIESLKEAMTSSLCKACEKVGR